MSILGKLFRKQAAIPKRDSEIPPSGNPESSPDLVRVFDKYGREFLISKDEWRTRVLPGTIQSHWNEPDQLYATIIGALNDGFSSDVVEAAGQLYRVDPIAARGACVYGIVLMENGRFDEADRVLNLFLQEHGENGAVLTNLARVYAGRKEMELAEATLWHALEVDPNQDNGLAWYEATHRERFGEEGGLNALRRIAELPGSWRAQVWLARSALKSGDKGQAITYYHETLSRSGKSIPADLLMQISGDLGKQGYLPELLELTEPYFVPENHGLQVGNNLIKAHLDLGQIDAARQIVDRLYSLKRPDWGETLNFWDAEISKARLEGSQAHAGLPLTLAMLSIDGPVWLNDSSPAAKLFLPNPRQGPTITFLGCSAEVATDSQAIQRQMSDGPGRMSRALPLFLAERVQFTSPANVRTLIPWIAHEAGGFLLSGVAWSDEDAAEHSGREGAKSDYVVVTHLKTRSDPWAVELRLVRSNDARCIGHLEGHLNWSNHAEGIRELAEGLQALLAQQVHIRAQAHPPLYEIPNPEYFPSYLLRLEQLLAVRCAAMPGISAGFLNGEREIIDGNLQLCLNCPQNGTTRVLLVQTLLTMSRIRPEIVQEFSGRIALVQKEFPIPGNAHNVIRDMLADLIGH